MNICKKLNNNVQHKKPFGYLVVRLFSYGDGQMVGGGQRANERYYDLRRNKFNYDEIVRPNHRRVVVVGAGQSGLAIANQIPRISGWAWQHVTFQLNKNIDHFNRRSNFPL